MKLEELIKNESEIAYFAKKMMKNKGKDCQDSITWKNEFEYHKQITDCLNELKTYREKCCGNKEDIELISNVMCNRAINDFVYWLKSQPHAAFESKTNEILVVEDDRWEYATTVYNKQFFK